MELVWQQQYINAPKYNRRKAAKGFADQKPGQTWWAVVWSWYCQSRVKLHVWVSLPLGPVGFVFRRPYQKRKRPEKKRGRERETSRMEGLSWEGEEGGRSWEKLPRSRSPHRGLKGRFGFQTNLIFSFLNICWITITQCSQNESLESQRDGDRRCFQTKPPRCSNPVVDEKKLVCEHVED